MKTVDELMQNGLRALFAIGVNQEYFNASREETADIGAALKDAFASLDADYGIRLIGTFDDDILVVRQSQGYPFVSYILADIPSIEAAVGVTNIVRRPYKDTRLIKYISIEARIGRPLEFVDEQAYFDRAT